MAAYHLTQQGAGVTVVDAGNARATDASFGWINARLFADDAHFWLRAEGIAAYLRLAKTLIVERQPPCPLATTTLADF